MLGNWNLEHFTADNAAVPKIAELTRSVFFTGSVLVFAGWVTGQLFWLAVVPDEAVSPSIPLQPLALEKSTTGPALALDYSVVNAKNPFAPDALSVASASAAPATELKLKLKGLRAASQPDAGTAMIAFETGSAKRFAAGMEILPDVRLVSVHPGYVILSRGGIAESLTFERPQLNTAPVTAPQRPMAQDRAEAIVPAAISGVMAFEPVTKDGTRYGYKVKLATDSAGLSGFPIVNGDLVIRLDGAPVPDFDAADLADRLRSYAPVTLTLLRGTREVQVSFPAEKAAMR